jgi:hypothetical protein
MDDQTCYKIVLTSLIRSWYKKNVTRLTTQSCNNIVISWLYRTCWNNLATSLIISTILLQVVNSLFHTCWRLVGRLVTRCEIFACVPAWLKTNEYQVIILACLWYVKVSIQCKMLRDRLFAIAFFGNTNSQAEQISLAVVDCTHFKRKRSQKIDRATFCTEWKSWCLRYANCHTLYYFFSLGKYAQTADFSLVYIYKKM